MQGVIDLVRREAVAGRFPMNLPLEMRFMADTEVYMAPCIGSNPQYGGSGMRRAVPDLPIIV